MHRHCAGARAVGDPLLLPVDDVELQSTSQGVRNAARSRGAHTRQGRTCPVGSFTAVVRSAATSLPAYGSLMQRQMTFLPCKQSGATACFSWALPKWRTGGSPICRPSTRPHTTPPEPQRQTSSMRMSSWKASKPWVEPETSKRSPVSAAALQHTSNAGGGWRRAHLGPGARVCLRPGGAHHAGQEARLEGLGKQLPGYALLPVPRVAKGGHLLVHKRPHALAVGAVGSVVVGAAEQGGRGVCQSTAEQGNTRSCQLRACCVSCTTPGRRTAPGHRTAPCWPAWRSREAGLRHEPASVAL